jgi:hypothetical protein
MLILHKLLIHRYSEAYPRLIQILHNPEIASGRCEMISCHFARFVKHHERIDSKILILETETPFSEETRIHKECFGDEPFRNHCVVRIGRLYIDWTARQFFPNVPVPFTYRDPIALGWETIKETDKTYFERPIKTPNGSSLSRIQRSGYQTATSI